MEHPCGVNRMPDPLAWTQLVEQANDIIVVFAVDGHVLYANARALATYGYSPAQFAALTERDLFPGGCVDAEADPAPQRLMHRHEDGRTLHLEGSITTVDLPTGPLRLLIARDITERLADELRQRLHSSVFEISPEAILVTDADQRIVAVNPAFTDITGYQPAEVIGERPKILSSGRHDRRFYEVLWHELAAKGRWQGEIWNRRKDGEVYPQWQTITVIRDGDGQPLHYVAIFADISERKAAEARISHLAYHDPLTGLPNRLLLRDRLTQALHAAERSGSRVGVLVLDLDHFKEINDGLGHAAGDALLQQVALRLTASVRQSDTVSRVGGDEFVIVLSGLEHEDDALLVTRKILESMKRPFELGGASVIVTPSIGVSFYPTDANTMEALLENADGAMYQSKIEGRNRARLHTDAEVSAAGR
jgi:diguanylate cyclase (GGDEF)-like protein/PAS domain S-box-containing protein